MRQSGGSGKWGTRPRATSPDPRKNNAAKKAFITNVYLIRASSTPRFAVHDTGERKGPDSAPCMCPPHHVVPHLGCRQLRYADVWNSCSLSLSARTRGNLWAEACVRRLRVYRPHCASIGFLAPKQ